MGTQKLKFFMQGSFVGDEFSCERMQHGWRVFPALTEIVASHCEIEAVFHTTSVSRYHRYTCIVFLLFFYQPPTKLGEGNVFTRICLSVCSHGGFLVQGPGPAPPQPCTGPFSVAGASPSLALDMLTLKHGRLASGRLAFSWKAFLFLLF